MAKNIYLVRHGQTLANIQKVHQSSDESLTPKGRLQARHVARVLEEKCIDALLCSTYTRARETAEIIEQELAVPFTTHASLVEIRRPDHLYGQGYYSPGTLRYMFQLFMNRENPNWDNNGAENMFALRNRMEDAKDAMLQTEGESIAVVSHDVFMNLFLEHICREKKLTLGQFMHTLLMTKRTPNTGIIHLQYEENAPKGVCAWQLISTINPSLKSA